MLRPRVITVPARMGTRPRRPPRSLRAKRARGRTPRGTGTASESPPRPRGRQSMIPVAPAPMRAGGVGKARRVPVANSTALVRSVAGGSGMAAASAGPSPVSAILESRARTTETWPNQRMTGPTATRVRTTQTGIAGARGTQADTAGCGVEKLEGGAAGEEARCLLTHVTAIMTVPAIPIMGALVRDGSPFGIGGMRVRGKAGRGRGGLATQALLGMKVAGGALWLTMTARTGTETESGMVISVGPRRTCRTRATIELMMHTMPIERQTSTRTPGTRVARNTQRTVALQMGRRGVRPGWVVRTGGQVQTRYKIPPISIPTHGTHALCLQLTHSRVRAPHARIRTRTRTLTRARTPVHTCVCEHVKRLHE